MPWTRSDSSIANVRPTASDAPTMKPASSATPIGVLTQAAIRFRSTARMGCRRIQSADANASDFLRRSRAPTESPALPRCAAKGGATGSDEASCVIGSKVVAPGNQSDRTRSWCRTHPFRAVSNRRIRDEPASQEQREGSLSPRRCRCRESMNDMLISPRSAISFRQLRQHIGLVIRMHRHPPDAVFPAARLGGADCADIIVALHLQLLAARPPRWHHRPVRSARDVALTCSAAMHHVLPVHRAATWRSRAVASGRRRRLELWATFPGPPRSAGRGQRAVVKMRCRQRLMRYSRAAVSIPRYKPPARQLPCRQCESTPGYGVAVTPAASTNPESRAE